MRNLLSGFQGLGDLPGGSVSSDSRGISGDGKVVIGLSSSTESFGGEGFRWDEANGLNGLGSLPGGTTGNQALAVSADGSTIVGRSGSSLNRDGQEVFRWTNETGMVGLGEIGFASGVSSNGSVVVGHLERTNGAYRWTTSGFEGLGNLNGGYASRAEAVSSDGSIVVGFDFIEPGRVHPFRWTSATGMVDLCDQTCVSGGAADAISDNGSIVVGRLNFTGSSEAFRWTAETGLERLGLLPNATSSWASDVSDNGFVVGTSTSPLGQTPFLWHETSGLVDLQAMLESHPELDSWTLTDATAISADGSTITGKGINPDGNAEAWLLQTQFLDPDDQVAEATELGRIESDVKLSNRINLFSDVDVYRFIARHSQQIAFDIDTASNGQPSLNSLIRLFDAEGRELARNDNAMAPGEPEAGFDSYLEFEFQRSGYYYVAVSNWENGNFDIETGMDSLISDPNSTHVGDYTLTLEDPDDQIVEATDLGQLHIPKTARQLVGQPQDVDMYSFTVEANQRVAFDIDRRFSPRARFEQPFARLTLFHEDGTRLDSAYGDFAPRESAPNESYLEYTFARSGKYFLGVSDRNNDAFDALNGVDFGGESIPKLRYYDLVVTPLTQFFDVDDGEPFRRGRLRLANADHHREFVGVQLKHVNDLPIEEFTRTWIVAHGRESDPGKVYEVGRLIQNQQPNDQVLMLNWVQGAEDNTIPLVGLDGAEWIPSLAHWMDGWLSRLSISSSDTFIAGHSWGSYVAYETAKVREGKIGGIVALDPARSATGYPFNEVDFSSEAQQSWAFYGRGSFGSFPLAATAHQAFSICYRFGSLVDVSERHDAPIVLFESLLASNSPLSQQFRVANLVNMEQPVFFREDVMDSGCSEPNDSGTHPFEGFFWSESERPGSSPLELNYVDQNDAWAKLV